ENARGLILEEKRKMRAKFIHFKFHNIERSILESAIDRGDRRLCNVVESAWRNGARFDLWDECFNYHLWSEAFAEFGFDLQTAAQRRFEAGEILPWEHLGGPEKKYLLNHLKKLLQKLKT
ncbi:MAG: B12-binding domain-containing radical SAM protein, partial [Planctomycetota bacterium]